MKKRYLLQIAGYFLFALLVFIGVFIQNFPYSTLEKRIESLTWNRFEQKIDIQGLHYDFPLGVYFQRIKVFPGNQELRKNLFLSDGKIHLHLFELLTAHPKTSFSLQVMKGSVIGAMQLDSLFQPREYDLDINWQGINFRDNPLDYDREKIKSIQGKCSGKLNLQGKLKKFLQASGEGNIKIKNAGLELSISPLPEHSFQDFQGNCNWKKKNRQLHIANCNLKGKGLQGKIKGKLGLIKPLAESKLNLSGSVKFTESDPEIFTLAQKYLNTQRLNFKLRGSLNNPTSSINK